MGCRSIFFPGWALAPSLYSELCSDSSLIIDFGYFDNHDESSLSLDSYEYPATDKETIVVGHSLGALFALETALRQTIKGLVLICPFARFIEDADYPGQSEKPLKSMIRLIDRRPEVTLTGFMQQVFSPVDVPESLVLPCNSQRLKSGLQILADIDLRNRISEISVPVCIICGGNDHVVKSETSKYLGKTIDNVELHELDDCGHGLPIINAGRVSAIIKEFASSL